MNDTTTPSTPTSSTDTIETRINAALDRIEDNLPPLPASIFRLNRSAAQMSCRVMSLVTSAFKNSAENVARQGEVAGRTVTGQARSAVDRTVSAGADAVREVTGQAKAQVEETIETAEDEAEHLADRIDDVEESLIDYDSWTKAELYELAQQRDIDGRAGMNKAELIDALS